MDDEAVVGQIFFSSFVDNGGARGMGEGSVVARLLWPSSDFCDVCSLWNDPSCIFLKTARRLDIQ